MASKAKESDAALLLQGTVTVVAMGLAFVFAFCALFFGGLAGALTLLKGAVMNALSFLTHGTGLALTLMAVCIAGLVAYMKIGEAFGGK